MAHESLLLPAAVHVVFPGPGGSAPVVHAIALDSLGIATLPGVTGRPGFVRILHSTAVAADGNAGECQALAEALARAWYLHAVARAEVSLSGIQPWQPSGLDDVVEWDHAGDHIVTRVRPRPWWDGEDDRWHHGALGSAQHITHGGITLAGPVTIAGGPSSSVTVGGGTTVQVGGPVSILLEDGGALLLEDGYPLLVDEAVEVATSVLVVPGATGIVLETGDALLLEDGISTLTAEDGASLTIGGEGKVTVEATLEVCGPLVTCEESYATWTTGALTPPSAPVARIRTPTAGTSITNVLPPSSPGLPAKLTLVVDGPESVTLVAGPNVGLPFDITLVPDAPLDLAWDVASAEWVPVGGAGYHHVVPPGNAMLLPEIAAPSTPASGYGAIYFDTSGQPMAINDSGATIAMGTTTANPTWAKYTKTYADFSTAGTSNTLTLATLAAKTFVLAYVIKHSTAFSGTGIIGYAVDLGITGNNTYYYTAFDVLQAVGNSVKVDAYPTAQSLLQFASTDVTITATSGGANLNAAGGAGSVDVWLLTSVLP